MRAAISTLLLGFIGATMAFECNPRHQPTARYTNEQEPRNVLSRSGISVNLGCKDRNANVDQTCLTGMEVSTVNAVVGLQSMLGSGCPVVVTGAAEIYPHGKTSFHALGQAVDLRMKACLTNYIQKNMRGPSTTSNGQKYWVSSAGNFYLNEGNHWHVQYCQN
ncbi:hypothetical protein K493DRAFT_412138 [Basidiobolus meristosporus CBS 931.73]|uniref:Uncharacterized protein n=1 Tax=Basidiobolus meristosporus CBS 931.73 TaxID=1314790 RepID=A0A1Y1X4C6_9FUNG|nr:hypothetical protein K493DRAFT_412138 [Basidiobolus meristosporus CBS 931.73]|eukprot:ORX80505.1 hypothetical protein K493DRAFT_412138 [Basidiobolus meristosporus CBS 931.73]